MIRACPEKQMLKTEVERMRILKIELRGDEELGDGETVLTSIAVLRVWILTLADSSRPYSFISVILPVSPSTP
jgi:hypothetical protein